MHSTSAGAHHGGTADKHARCPAVVPNLPFRVYGVEFRVSGFRVHGFHSKCVFMANHTTPCSDRRLAGVQRVQERVQERERVHERVQETGCGASWAAARPLDSKHQTMPKVDAAGTKLPTYRRVNLSRLATLPACAANWAGARSPACGAYTLV